MSITELFFRPFLMNWMNSALVFRLVKTSTIIPKVPFSLFIFRSSAISLWIFAMMRNCVLFLRKWCKPFQSSTTCEIIQVYFCGARTIGFAIKAENCFNRKQSASIQPKTILGKILKRRSLQCHR